MYLNLKFIFCFLYCVNSVVGNLTIIFEAPCSYCSRFGLTKKPTFALYFTDIFTVFCSAFTYYNSSTLRRACSEIYCASKYKILRSFQIFTGHEKSSRYFWDDKKMHAWIEQWLKLNSPTNLLASALRRLISFWVMRMKNGLRFSHLRSASWVGYACLPCLVPRSGLSPLSGKMLG